MLPTNSLCPHCKTSVTAPLWSESEQNWIHFVWKCTECGSQFKTAAIYDILQRTWFERSAPVTTQGALVERGARPGQSMPLFHASPTSRNA
jgi:hypothetical protein